MSSIEGPGSSGGLGGVYGDGGGSPKPSGYGYKKGESLKDWMESYLGPEGWKKFQANLCSLIQAQIQREQQKAHEAAERLKRAETGEDS